MATSYFRNPTNGYVTKATGELPWLWQLLLGPIYLGFKGLWGHAFLLLVLALLGIGTAGLTLVLSWLVYPFMVGGLIRKRYLEQGWSPVTSRGAEVPMQRARGVSLPGRAVRLAVVGLAAVVVGGVVILNVVRLVDRSRVPVVPASAPAGQTVKGWIPAVERSSPR